MRYTVFLYSIRRVVFHAACPRPAACCPAASRGMAGFPMGWRDRAVRGYRTRGIVCRIAGARVAPRAVDRIAGAARWRGRGPLASARPGAGGRAPAGRPGPAAASATGVGLGWVAARSGTPALGAARYRRRCPLGSRPDSQERQLRRVAVLAASRARRRSAPPARRRAGLGCPLRRDPASRGQPAGLAGAAAYRGPTRRRRCAAALRQAPGARARSSSSRSLAGCHAGLFVVFPCPSGSASSCRG